ncbi:MULTISPECIES: hypothetical protein [Halomonadaceae]|uniref:hypothetical protein n=1 Tax=Halomonadaceae TaxID=28256 RepID=UPI001599F7AA|nr:MULTISPECIES: hypothetical protein [Halomonas]QJQ96188.1 hypothetical protein HIO72_13540 [Halomonas sp. PA5]
MAIRLIKRLLRGIRTRHTTRQHYNALREYDPRMLKDVGLRWERGNLVAINPERELPVAAGAEAAAMKKRPDACPSCGVRLT